MIIDTNVHLSRYPTRRLRGEDPQQLVSILRANGVTQAWAGSFDGLLHKDISAVNARLSDDCQRHGGGVLTPFGEINVTLPGWEEDLRRCHEVHKMPGIRVHPNYHGYTLDDVLLTRLVDLATRRKLIVQIVLNIEDDRTQHRMLRVPPLVLNSLPALLTAVPDARLMLLNARTAPAAPLIRQLPPTAQVLWDIGMTESVEGVKTWTQAAGVGRIAYGSHAPFYYAEGAAMKMREANLDSATANAVLFENAQRLLKW